MNFATRLTIIMSGVLVFFAVIVFYVVYKSNIETLENEIKGRQIDTAQHIMDKIDRMLFERTADIKVITSDPIVSSRDSTPKQIRERLSEFRNYYKTYISISFFDLNRVRITDTAGLDIGVQHPLDRYWADVLERKDFIMDVSESESVKKTVIHFGFPVTDKSGETFGVVITRMPISKLYYIIRDFGEIQTENKNLQIDLIDKDALLLYSSYNRKGILKDNMAEWEIVRNSLVRPEISTGRFNHGGIEDIYVFVHERGYLDFKGNDWSLLVHSPIKVAFAPAVELRNTVTYFLAVALILSIIIAFFFARSITKPIASLAKSTKIIGKGKLDYKINVERKDEIGDLSRAFDHMTENLKKVTVSRDQLEKEIVERKQVEEQLMAAFKDKEMLLSEVHHRVKNNMQVIISLLGLQSKKIKDKQYAGMFEESRNRIQSMVLIHENLYESKDFANIDFDGYVNSLANNLFSSYGVNPNQIKLNVEIKDISLGLDNAVPCGLIINELVSNSLKYAFPEGRGGRIIVALGTINENEIELTVSDDGIGLPQDTDIRNAESMGFRLVMALAEYQLKGKIELSRTKGTKYHVRFKKKNA